jgi:hypothetical protein
MLPKIITAAAAALLLTAACSSSGSGSGSGSGCSSWPSCAHASQAESSKAKGCQPGEPVGHPKGDDPPACVDEEGAPAATTLSSACYTYTSDGLLEQHGIYWTVMYPGRSLYGKPGGTWHNALTDQLDRPTLKAIGC